MRATRAQRAYHAVQARGLVRAWERHSERGNRPALTRPTGCGRSVVVAAAACRKLSACRICALLGHGLKSTIARRVAAASAPTEGLARAWRPRDHVGTVDVPPRAGVCKRSTAPCPCLTPHHLLPRLTVCAPAWRGARRSSAPPPAREPSRDLEMCGRTGCKVRETV